MALRICIAYDCLYPFTVGGHERWLRLLAEALAERGHEVTFLTRLQWDAPPSIPGVRVVAVSPREELYAPDGTRRNGPPVKFGLGVGRHLARHRRAYDVVHTCAFPYFHLPALRAALAGTGVPVTVDWPEVWSSGYWQRYSGRVAGGVGAAVQALCVRLTPQAVVFSRTHGDRLAALGLKRPAERPGGLGPAPVEAVPSLVAPPSPRVVFAGRLIPEKRAPLAVAAAEVARASAPGLTLGMMGDGPEKDAVLQAVSGRTWAEFLGFVPRPEVEAQFRDASVLLAPSEREGFGIVVLEAASLGTPVVVVAGPDNASTELIEPGVNGFVAASATPEAVGAAVLKAIEGGSALRASTAAWYAEHAPRLAMSRTIDAMEQLFVRLAAAR